MRDIPCYDDGAGEGETSGHGMLAQLSQNFRHRPVEVDLDDMPFQIFVCHIWKVFGWIGFKLFQKDALLGDFSEDLSIG